MKLIVLFVVVLYVTQSVVDAVDGGTAAGSVLGVIVKVLQNSDQRGVIVTTQATAPIVLSCASADDRIHVNDNPHPVLSKGQILAWSFKVNFFPGFSGRTQFWCTIVYNNKKKCGGDVFYQNWGDAPKIVTWTIEDNCVVRDWNNRARPDIFRTQ